MMKIALGIVLAFAARAEAISTNTLNDFTLIPNQSANVVLSSIPISQVMVASHTPTLVDAAKLAGSFSIEVQNADATNDVCCAFTTAFSTVTTSAQGRSCRVVKSGMGTWTINRWHRDLTLYCQTLYTSGTSPVRIVQGR